MKILVSLFVLVFSTATFANCRLDFKAGTKAFVKGDENVEYSRDKLISMKKARSTDLYCSLGRDARMGVLAAANSYKASYDLYTSVSESCEESQYSASSRYAELAFDRYEEHAQVLKDMDRLLVRDCDENPIAYLLD